MCQWCPQHSHLACQSQESGLYSSTPCTFQHRSCGEPSFWSISLIGYPVKWGMIQHISSITAPQVRKMCNKRMMIVCLSFLFAYPNCCRCFSHWCFLFPKILSLCFYIKNSLRRFVKFQSPLLTIWKYSIIMWKHCHWVLPGPWQNQTEYRVNRRKQFPIYQYFMWPLTD